GVTGAAGVYLLLGLAQVPFVGLSAIGSNPLATAVATAVLGRNAFQGSFTDPSKSSADRIMGAFPAVAAALGLSAGIAAVTFAAAPVSLLAATATGMMTITGISSAIYAAMYTPGKSPAAGPASMTRGYVLQTLMSGMALAVAANPYTVLPFAVLGA